MNHPELRQIPLSEYLDICRLKKFKIMQIYKCRYVDQISREEMEKSLREIVKAKNEGTLLIDFTNEVLSPATLQRRHDVTLVPIDTVILDKS